MMVIFQMLTDKFTQKFHVLWRLLTHSQAPLISHRSNCPGLLQTLTFSKIPNGITGHRLSSCSSIKTCKYKSSMTPCNDKANMSSNHERPYQVVVAATRDMGIGKDGKLPWNLPSDLRYFKEVTTTTSATGKRNAVIMGRKTWESIPHKYRPLPARLNLVLTRSGKLEGAKSEDLVICSDLSLAMKFLAKPPYSLSVEKVFIIGGGQVLKEALNAPGCEAIHLTNIEINFNCDTFIPHIDSSLFHKWCSTGPMVENNVQFSFVTYVRALISSVESSATQNGVRCNNTIVPEGFCCEFHHLKQVQELIASQHALKDGTRDS